MDNASPSPKMDLKNITWIIYGCWIAGILSNAIHFLGILPLVGLIIALVKKKEAAGTIYESHMTWVIRSFIIGIIAAIVCAVLVFVYIGILGFVLLGLWSLWRLIKGCLRLYDNKAIENPEAFI